MDLVDEEDVAALKLCQDSCQVARLLDLRAIADVNFPPHRGRNDVGQARLAEAGRAAEQDVVEHIAALPGGLHPHGQQFDRLLLALELGENRRPKGDVKRRSRGFGRLLVDMGPAFGHCSWGTGRPSRGFFSKPPRAALPARSREKPEAAASRPSRSWLHQSAQAAEAPANPGLDRAERLAGFVGNFQLRQPLKKG